MLAAALDALAEGSTPSLREVARRAGVSPAAVYHHFADKRALLVAVADEGFRGLHLALSDPEGHDPEDRLRRMSEAYVRFAVAHPAHYQVMFDPELGNAAEPSTLEASAREAFEALVQAMAPVFEGREAELVRRAVLAWALAHGAVQLVVGGLTLQLDATLDAEGIAVAVGDAIVRLAR